MITFYRGPGGGCLYPWHTCSSRFPLERSLHWIGINMDYVIDDYHYYSDYIDDTIDESDKSTCRRS